MNTARPTLLGRRPRRPVRATVLLLPGGSIRSHRTPLRLADLGTIRPRLILREHSEPDGLAVHLLRYRYRGWNGPDADAAADTRWALDELARRYPGTPVVLVGNSLGGRAAVACAGHRIVSAVAGIAPWLPAEQPMTIPAGHQFLIVHGAIDRSDAPAADSLAFARRARDAGVVTARFVVPRAGHFLLRRQSDWSALVVRFTLAAAGIASMPAVLARAAASDAGLSMPLPAADQLDA